jgi:hypothetical protein
VFLHSVFYTHVDDGGCYYLMTAKHKMKHPDTGEWLQAVVYKSMNKEESYTTTLERWNTKFKLKVD